MAKYKFSRFDPAKYLKSDEAIVEFLNATIEENHDDPAAILRAMETVIRARNVSQIARDAGLSREGLYKAFSEDGNPSFDTVQRVLAVLGLRISFEPSEAA
jgi:probable addiction module antidote protein